MAVRDFGLREIELDEGTAFGAVYGAVYGAVFITCVNVGQGRCRPRLERSMMAVETSVTDSLLGVLEKGYGREKRLGIDLIGQDLEVWKGKGG